MTISTAEHRTLPGHFGTHITLLRAKLRKMLGNEWLTEKHSVDLGLKEPVRILNNRKCQRWISLLLSRTEPRQVHGGGHGQLVILTAGQGRDISTVSSRICRNDHATKTHGLSLLSDDKSTWRWSKMTKYYFHVVFLSHRLIFFYFQRYREKQMLQKRNVLPHLRHYSKLVMCNIAFSSHMFISLNSAPKVQTRQEP